MHPGREIRRNLALSRILQDLLKLRTCEDCLCLPQSLYLFVPGRLAKVEVLQDEIATLLQLGIVIRELLQLEEYAFFRLLGLDEIDLRLGLLLRFVHDVPALRLDRVVGLLDKILIRFLRIFLRSDGLSLHGLGISDDLLDHAHHTPVRRIVLVLFKTWWWGWADRLLLLDQRCSWRLLGIEVLQDAQGSLQQLLRLPLVSYSALEFLVLLLAVFTSTLQLDLHLSNLCLQCVNRFSQGLDGRLQVCDPRQQVLLFAFFLLRLQLVCVELVCAEVLVLDLVCLLLQKLSDHIVDGLLDTSESIQLDSVGQSREPRVVELQRNLGQQLRCLLATLRMRG